MFLLIQYVRASTMEVGTSPASRASQTRLESPPHLASQHAIALSRTLEIVAAPPPEKRRHRGPQSRRQSEVATLLRICAYTRYLLPLPTHEDVASIILNTGLKAAADATDVHKVTPPSHSSCSLEQSSWRLAESRHRTLICCRRAHNTAAPPSHY